MSKQLIEYFSSKIALKLWVALSCVFIVLLFTMLRVNNETLTVVQGILFVTDLLHFWLPIFVGRYLYKISQDVPNC